MNSEKELNPPAEIREHKIEAGYYFSEGIDNEFWKMLRENAAKNRIPIHGHFELTPLCMLNCKMCYVHLTEQEKVTESLLCIDDWKSIIDLAIEQGMLFASLSGGECLMCPFFDELYLYLKSRGIFIFILTNGVLLDTKLQLFVQNNPTLIQVSMYGWDEDSYESVTGYRYFQRVSSAIQKAVSKGINVSIAITPSRYLKAIDKIAIEYIKKNIGVDVNSWIIPPRKSTGRDYERISLTPKEQVQIAVEFHNVLGKAPLVPYSGELPPTNTLPSQMPRVGLKCAAGRTDFNISWRGEMTLCASLDTPVAFPLADGFEASWRKCVKVADNFAFPVECEDCSYKSVCKFCPAHQLVTGDGTHCNPSICEETLMMVRCGLKHFE